MLNILISFFFAHFKNHWISSFDGREAKGGEHCSAGLLSSPASPESYSLVFVLSWATMGHIIKAVWCQHSVHSFPTLTESLMNYYNLLIMLKRNTSFINTVFNHSGLQSSTAFDHSKQLPVLCICLCILLIHILDKLKSWRFSESLWAKKTLLKSPLSHYISYHTE